MNVKKYSIRYLFLLLFLNQTILFASDSFEMEITIQETSIEGIEKFKNTYNVNLSKNKINKNIKYKIQLTQIAKKILQFEQRYDNENLYFLDEFKDSKGNIWTISSNIKSNDVSVTHFISKQTDKIIDGWINRDNKDIFGFRIFNF